MLTFFFTRWINFGILTCQGLWHLYLHVFHGTQRFSIAVPSWSFVITLLHHILVFISMYLNVIIMTIHRKLHHFLCMRLGASLENRWQNSMHFSLCCKALCIAFHLGIVRSRVDFDYYMLGTHGTHKLFRIRCTWGPVSNGFKMNTSHRFVLAWYWINVTGCYSGLIKAWEIVHLLLFWRLHVL